VQAHNTRLLDQIKDKKRANDPNKLIATVDRNAERQRMKDAGLPTPR
jgi:hypothetical protein